MLVPLLSTSSTAVLVVAHSVSVVPPGLVILLIFQRCGLDLAAGASLLQTPLFVSPILGEADAIAGKGRAATANAKQNTMVDFIRLPFPGKKPEPPYGGSGP